MTTDREDIDGIFIESVNYSVFSGETSRPKSSEVLFELFGPSDALSGVSALHLLQDTAQVPMQLSILRAQ